MCAFGFGIRLENSSGYNVVDNDFTKYGTSSTGDYYGVAILVPDPSTSEEIYRNSFSNLKYANYVKGESTNAVKLDPNAGVLYQCNSNTSNYTDFFSHAAFWLIFTTNISTVAPAPTKIIRSKAAQFCQQI